MFIAACFFWASIFAVAIVEPKEGINSTILEGAFAVFNLSLFSLAVMAILNYLAT